MSRTIQTAIVINASKEKVWEVLTDFSSYPQWNPFMIKVEGKPELGARLTNTMLNDGKTFVFKPKVTQAQRFQYFEWLGSLFVKGIFDGRHYFRIEELAPGQVKLTHGEHFSGILSGPIFKKLGESTRNNFVLMNNALRQRAEALALAAS